MGTSKKATKKKKTPARKVPPRGKHVVSKKRATTPTRAAKPRKRGLPKPVSSRPRAKKPKAPAKKPQSWNQAAKKARAKEKRAAKAREKAAAGWYVVPQKPPSRQQQKAFFRAQLENLEALDEASDSPLSASDYLIAEMTRANTAGELDQIIRDIIASGDWGDYESDELYDLFYGYGDDI